tara:strand:+ start:145 stop:381 length:237 start_codon:yes stop_codon:yes gene_type:complete
MKKSVVSKFLLLILYIVLFSGFETKKPLLNENHHIIQNYNQANELGVDFMCYNMCKDTTRGMSLSQLDKFCKLQCPKK